MYMYMYMVILTYIGTLFKHVLSAGGRGGAIATKGGSGYHGQPKFDPNDDSGSFSVILVVILPVAQMIAVLFLVLLIRICYRKYCYKQQQQHHQHSEQHNCAVKKPIHDIEANHPSRS